MCVLSLLLLGMLWDMASCSCWLNGRLSIESGPELLAWNIS